MKYPKLLAGESVVTNPLSVREEVSCSAPGFFSEPCGPYPRKIMWCIVALYDLTFRLWHYYFWSTLKMKYLWSLKLNFVPYCQEVHRLSPSFAALLHAGQRSPKVRGCIAHPPWCSVGTLLSGYCLTRQDSVGHWTVDTIDWRCAVETGFKFKLLRN